MSWTMTYQENVLSGADHSYCLNTNTADMCFERAAEHSKGFRLNGLSTGRKTTPCFPPGTPLDLKRMKMAKKECSETGPCRWTGEEKDQWTLSKESNDTDRIKNISAARLRKVSWAKSQVERSVQTEGTHCTWLIFSLLMIRHVFFTPAVMQCSCTAWNHCHILPTGAATFCIGVKMESY